MGESHLTAPEAASYELALANRKLVTVVMGMTLLMGLVACLAYLAGRSVTGIRANQENRIVVPAPVIVQPDPKAEKPVAVPVVEAVATPAVVPVPVPESVPAEEKAVARVPRLYLQVAAAEFPDFQPLRSELERDGYPLEVIRLDDKHRLLIGPLRDEQQRSEFEARLAAAGRPFFLRQY